MLTDFQRAVLTILRRRDCHIVAGQVENAWSTGQHSYLDARLKCPQWLWRMFFEANADVRKIGTKVCEAAPADLFAWRPRRRKRSQAIEWKIVALRASPSPDELALCDTPQQVVEYWHRHVATAPHFTPECECFAVLLLNVKMRVRGHHLVSIGSLNETMAHPREVFRAAVIAAAYAVVLIRNHPSGDPTPSDGDRQITKVIAEAGRILRIHVTDHVIVGYEKHCSFREAGLL